MHAESSQKQQALNTLPVITEPNMNPTSTTRRAFVQALALGAASGTAHGILADEPAAPQHGVKAIVSEGLGRIVILSFDRGARLREGIRDKLKELGIRNAVLVSAIGTFEKARFHRIKNTNPHPEDEIIEVEGPMELAAGDGNVADGEPHFHMVFEDLNRAYAVHLEDGSVDCYLAKIVLAELKGVELTRVRNQYGIRLLQQK
jgi:uncharacterized protein